jgi:hypothetical protein
LSPRSREFTKGDGEAAAVEPILRSFFERLGRSVGDAAENDKEDLINVLDGKYSVEEDFDRALFEKLVACFKADDSKWEVQEEKRNKNGKLQIVVLVEKKQGCRVLSVGNTLYGLGLARDTYCRERESCLIRSCRPDHICAIFHKDTTVPRSEWEIFQLLSSVEVKLDTTSCKVFETYLPTREAVEQIVGKRINLSNEHCALGQAIAYSFGYALWGRSALGIPLPETLPFAVVAAAKNPAATPDMPPGTTGSSDAAAAETSCATLRRNANRLTLGSLLIPEECGGRFSFQVQAFETFETSTPSAALAVYLKVLLEGFPAGEEWIRTWETPESASRSEFLLPSAMCGRQLRFGNGTLTSPELSVQGGGLRSTNQRLLLLSGPTYAFRDSASRGESQSIRDIPRLNQGELLEMRINLTRLRDRTSASDCVFWCPRKSPFPSSEHPVLVKVSSISCYGHFAGERGFLYELPKNKSTLSPDTLDEILRLLADSLYAVYVPHKGVGVVQILPDLRTVGYVELRPEKQLLNLEQWKEAWDAFVKLVEDTLIPLAKQRLVHPDIRPGYEKTANLVFRGGSRKKMLMIDLDSLVEFSVCESLMEVHDQDKRLLSVSDAASFKTPVEFVYGQVAFIAYSWINKKSSCDVDVVVFADEWQNRLAVDGFDEADILRGMDQFWSELSSKEHVMTAREIAS